MNRELPPSSSPESPTPEKGSDTFWSGLVEWVAQHQKARRANEVIEQCIALFLEQKKEESSDATLSAAEPQQPSVPPSQEEEPPPRRRNKVNPVKGALLGLAGTAALMAANARVDEMERADLAAHEQTMKELNKGDAEKIRERIGFDLAALARQFGFEAQLSVDNGTGKYVLHIGQTHTYALARYTEGLSFDFFEPAWKTGQDKDTKESQQRIINLLTSIRSTSEGTKPLEILFCEGESNETINDSTKKWLQHLRGYLNEIEALAIENPKTPRELVDCYQRLTKATQLAKKQQSVRLASIILYVKKAIDAKTAAVLQRYKTPLPSGELGFQIMRLNIEPTLMNLELLDNDLVLEASWQLILQGVVQRLAPAETQKVSARSMEQLQKIQTLSESIRQAQNAGDMAKVGKIMEEFKRVKDRFIELAMEPREDIAISYILDELSRIRGRIIPLIYGSDHSFANNVRDKAPGKLGLIDLIPLSGTHKRKAELFENRQKGRLAGGASQQRRQLQKNQPRGKGR